MNLPLVFDFTEGLYDVCCVLPQDPTPEQFDDLAVRMSNFLEDVHRCHVDRRTAVTDELGVLCPPTSLPIIHRAKLREAQLRDELRCPPARADDFADVARSISEAIAFHGVTERETFCMLYLHVPRWRGFERSGQLAKLDEVARLHGLRCIEIGALPSEDA